MFRLGTKFVLRRLWRQHMDINCKQVFFLTAMAQEKEVTYQCI